MHITWQNCNVWIWIRLCSHSIHNMQYTTFEIYIYIYGFLRLCFRGCNANFWWFMWCICSSLRWRHNELDGVSDHQPHDCLLNLLFRRRSKKTSKLRVTGLCAGNSPWTGEFSAQKASNAENVSISWRHHVFLRVVLLHSRMFVSVSVKIPDMVKIVPNHSTDNKPHTGDNLVCVTCELMLIEITYIYIYISRMFVYVCDYQPAITWTIIGELRNQREHISMQFHSTSNNLIQFDRQFRFGKNVLATQEWGILKHWLWLWWQPSFNQLWMLDRISLSLE